MRDAEEHWTGIQAEYSIMLHECRSYVEHDMSYCQHVVCLRCSVFGGIVLESCSSKAAASIDLSHLCMLVCCGR